MITLAQIMEVSRVAALRDLNKPYELGPVTTIPRANGFYMNLYDPMTDITVPLVWTNNDNVKGTEEDRVDVATSLIANGIEALEVVIEEQQRLPFEDAKPYVDPTESDTDAR